MTAIQNTASKPLHFCGEPVSSEQLTLIIDIFKRFSGLSRTELTHTVCELLDWVRPNGKLKTPECRKFLEVLETQGLLQLPALKFKGRGKSKKIIFTSLSDEGKLLKGTVKDFRPVNLRLVSTKQERTHFRELIERYHYLGYRTPFGAHLSYLIEVTHPTPTVVGAIQLSSPAWRMAPRDQWIGWSDTVRASHLQRIVNNSRFLILPSAKIKFLASHVLSQVSRRLVIDWKEKYHIEPLLLETLVDTERFTGVCYRAANWLALGRTSGRGRQDREHLRHDASPKSIFIYPLRIDARQRLQEA